MVATAGRTPTTRDNDIIPSTDKQAHHAKKIKQTMITIAKNHLALGQQLIAAKEDLEHGQFIPMYLSIGLPEREAQRHMALAKLRIVNTTNLSLLSFNDTQLKKLDKMPEEEAKAIIKDGVFPKPTPQPKVKKEDVIIDAEVVDDDTDYKALSQEYYTMFKKEHDLNQVMILEIEDLNKENHKLKGEVARLKADASQDKVVLSSDELEAFKKYGSIIKRAKLVGLSKAKIQRLYDGDYTSDTALKVKEFLEEAA